MTIHILQYTILIGCFIDQPVLYWRPTMRFSVASRQGREPNQITTFISSPNPNPTPDPNPGTKRPNPGRKLRLRYISKICNTPNLRTTIYHLALLVIKNSPGMSRRLPDNHYRNNTYCALLVWFVA